ncbi:MAG: SPFH domain-containing protein [Bacteroidetes bacterium]|nr:SPFH domain-containing protein [Bacteroidota bacterium]
MGLFNKNRTDGRTFDGTDNSRKGVIDRIKYDGPANELIWKFPYDNLTIGAQLIVNESQEAIFYKGGKALDSFGPGTHTISTANIPLLQKLINLPFGGKTPFAAEVWYINKTIKRDLKWGTKTPMKLRDPLYGFIIPVRAYGEYGIQINDARSFMTQIVGTLHTADIQTIQQHFTSLIITKVTDTISKYIVQQKVSVVDIPAHVDDISKTCKNRISEEFEKYGILITNFYAESINYPEDHPQVEQINQSQADALSRKLEGYTYQQERSFDVMDSAAQNEGNSGNLMGAGMGLGMGFGIGGAMGNQMGNMGSQLNTGQNQPQATPPPPPGSAIFVLVNNKQEGPFNLEQLKSFIQNGQITKETLAWKEGMAQWDKAENLPEIKQLFGTSTPPPPPPPQP